MSTPFAPLQLAAADGAQATILPYGAHVVGWRPAPDESGAAGERPGRERPDGDPGRVADRLFVSERTAYEVGTAVRGGIPVIFPQFSDRVPGPDPSIRHGFARTRPWTLVRHGRTAGGAADGDNGAAEATFALVDDAETRARWPHAFRVELTVRVGGATLTVTLAVENPGDTPFAFTGALHSYLRVGDIAQASVRGVAGVRGHDSVSTRPIAPASAPVRFGAEIDQLYFDVPGPVTLDDPILDRAVRALATGFRDVVVWNPGPVRGATLTDLPREGWRDFVCVEAVAAHPVPVAPGERWTGTQQLTAVHTEQRLTVGRNG